MSPWINGRYEQANDVRRKREDGEKIKAAKQFLIDEAEQSWLWISWML
jgi:hypothetical protein